MQKQSTFKAKTTKTKQKQSTFNAKTKHFSGNQGKSGWFF